MIEKTVCELFAGVGGFRLGLEESSPDWKTVWFSQWEPGKKSQWAHDCYVSHWGDIDENTGIDISEVDKKKIPAHNLLVGGFPCQDYSVARPLSNSSGIEGKKGILWWQIYDLLKAQKAPFVLLENVDRLLRSPASQKGRDFGVILACLDELGYSVEWRVVNAADYGQVQRRRRTFIFAYRNDTRYAVHAAKKSAHDIVSSYGMFAIAFPLEECKLSKATDFSLFDDIYAVSDNFSFNFNKAGYMHDGKVYTYEIVPKVEDYIPLNDVLEKDVEDKYFIEAEKLEKWKYLKGSKKITRTSHSGHEYVFSEGAIAFPDPLDKPARTMLTSEGTLNRSSHLVCDPQRNAMRIITPLEAERIQGFKDNWTNSGMPERMRYFCMGNALVVPLVTRMGNVLNDIFENE